MQPLDPFTVDADLLTRYLAGQTTPPETDAVRDWIAARPENARALAALEQAAGLSGVVADAIPEPSDAGPVMDRIVANLAATLPPLAERPALTLHRPARRAFRVWARAGSWAAAAVVLLAMGAGLELWRVAALRRASATRTAEPDYREYVTRPGERAEFRLGDGTRVVLGVASTLRVPRDYGQGAREVRLDGQAYFDVVHDASHPFRVHAGNAIATDLGTRFNVRSYGAEARAEVVVAAGRVALAAPGARAITPPPELGPGDLGVIDSTGLPRVRHGVDVGRYLGWLDGNLAFDGARLHDVIPELERWYDLDIRLTDTALGSRRVTVTLRDEAAPQALDRLAALLELRVERDGQTVTLAPASPATAQ